MSAKLSNFESSLKVRMFSIPSICSMWQFLQPRLDIVWPILYLIYSQLFVFLAIVFFLVSVQEKAKNNKILPKLSFIKLKPYVLLRWHRYISSCIFNIVDYISYLTIAKCVHPCCFKVSVINIPTFVFFSKNIIYKL